MDADGSNAKELPIPKTDSVHDWSRDGKWLVTERLGVQLYVMHLDGTGQRRLTKDGTNSYPRFSPDSRKIVYHHWDKEDCWSIWVVDADGKNARAVMKEEGLVAPVFACWSPDGKRLMVIRHTWELDEKGQRHVSGPDNADFHIQIMDADGQNCRRLDLADAKVTWLGLADWR
jgi:Tol biopolymer transport system component